MNKNSGFRGLQSFQKSAGTSKLKQVQIARTHFRTYLAKKQKSTGHKPMLNPGLYTFSC